MTLRIMTFIITSLNITTLSIMASVIYDKCPTVVSDANKPIMLGVIMLNVVAPIELLVYAFPSPFESDKATKIKTL